MIPRLQVDVRVPRACYEPLGVNYHAIQVMLRQAGVLSPKAEDVRWRADVETMGYIVSYSVAVPQRAPESTP